MPAGAAIRFWYLLYNAVLHLGALVCLPYWLFVRFARGRYRGQFAERMGFLPAAVRERFGARPAVWIHAASAGETVSAAPLLRHLREAFPGRPFYFTVTSRYGREMATRRLEGLVEGIGYSPLDLPLFCRRVADRIRPGLYVMVETDLWPNLVRLLHRRGVPVAVASGQAGPRSFPRPFWRTVLSHVDLLLMQTEADAKHIVGRGAPPERVRVAGNLKFDGSGEPLSPAERAALRDDLGLPPGVPVLVCGSTLAEDEGPLLDAVARLRREGRELHAVVAPRRQERVAGVLEGCAARGLKAVRRTEGGGAPVLVLDTMGELARVYNVASAAYVGGGWTPGVGLHNLIEPLVAGAPVLFGPNHGKAARIAAEFLRLGAGIEVADGPALLAALARVLDDEGQRARLARAGEELLALHRGAAARQAHLIAEIRR